MKCDYCHKGRPGLWNKDGKFCNEECYGNWKEKNADIYGKKKV